MRRSLIAAGCLVLMSATLAFGQAQPWLGVHVLMTSSDKTTGLTEVVDELAAVGINTIVAEINYGFEYRSHPDLRAGNPSTAEQIGKLVVACREHGIRLIPHAHPPRTGRILNRRAPARDD